MKLRFVDLVKALRAIRQLVLCVRAKEDRSYEKALNHYEAFCRGGWEKPHHRALAADLQLLLGNGRDALSGYLEVIEELEARSGDSRSVAAEYTMAYSKMRIAGLHADERLRASFRREALALKPPSHLSTLLPAEHD